MSSYRTITTTELVHRQSEWRILVESASPQLLFMQPEYLATWMAIFVPTEKRALYGVVDENDRLVAILPFYFEDDNTLRLIGAVELSDYLDLVLEQSPRPELISYICEFVGNLGQPWQTLLLESLPAESATLTEVSKAFEKAGWQVAQREQTVCPVITLPTSWETYLASLDPKAQHNFKKLQKNIGVEDEISYRCLTTPKDIEIAIPAFIKLHKASGSEKNQFWTDERERFFKEMSIRLAEAGWLKLYFLDIDGQPAASLLVFDYHNQFLLYNSGFDAYRYGHLGVGNALILYTIREAIKHGRDRYDFMRGDESYKFLFGAKPESIYDLTVTRH